MGNAFQDQFLKAGLIDKQKAQKISGARRKKQKRKEKGGEPTIDRVQTEVHKAQSEKVMRDRELNRIKQQEREQKSIAAQIQQLIQLNVVECEEDGVSYHFVDGKQVRQLSVSEKVHHQLATGSLSIVKTAKGYQVIPTIVANKIKVRDASIIIPIQSSIQASVANDPYADYQVPDDLMW